MADDENMDRYDQTAEAMGISRESAILTYAPLLIDELELELQNTKEAVHVLAESIVAVAPDLLSNVSDVIYAMVRANSSIEKPASIAIAALSRK